MNFNEIIEKTKRWIENNEIPSELKEKFNNLAQWKSQNKLAKAIIFWRYNRFDRDEKIYAVLESWRKQDKHLYEWEDNQRKNVINWRKYYYQNWVLNLRKKYGTIGVEDINWAYLQRKEGPEELDRISTINRAIAAVGMLREIIEETGLTKRLDAANSTKTCYSCKEICDVEKEQFHECEYCGVVWDRDYNAPKNLLKAMREVQ